MNYENSEKYARSQDELDPLKDFRRQFHIPKSKDGTDCLYFCGNSLGLQPKKTKEYVNEELDDWAMLGVEGHFEAKHPWMPYHEFLTQPTSRIVGAKPKEVVVMNSLTVNLHFLFVSFYRPTQKRYKILVEASAFPSDQYAVYSQALFHAQAQGFDAKRAIVELTPRPGEATIRTEDILQTLEREGDEIALIWLGGVNYLTGQAYDMKTITEAGHKKGCTVGFDLAHAAGNLLLKLHDWNVDCAAWCSYKYLNAGPGAIGGIFVHERHSQAIDLPRFTGWWGHDKETRFKMGPVFKPIPGAEGWQVSNPPILQLAALRASMEIFDQATMQKIRTKGDLLTGYLEYLLKQLPSDALTITTPSDPKDRGCQLSLKFKAGKSFQKQLAEKGVICDFREPDVLRAAPAPLYNTFLDVYRFVEVVKSYAKN